VSLLPLVFPLVALERLFPKLLPQATERLLCWALDIATILRMRPCDIFICMSGVYVQAPRFARWRYGARIILHRGSRHILSQKDILASLSEAQQVSQFIIERELRGYEIADKIAVPSTHVMESFRPWGWLGKKIFVSYYGVDLDMFPLRSGESVTEPIVLFVGNWSYQKGADLLSKAIMEIDDVTLVHVGALSDVPFPRHARFIHYPPVPQWELKTFYATALVFALASRQEGFAMVLSQAVATGLPIVCTDRTGGADLAHLEGIGHLIRVVPTGDAEALRQAIVETVRHVRQTDLSIKATDREVLGWRRYALRHLEVMTEMLSADSIS
jgi:glycosyltransferase involved in cell wall biosynthesis